MAKSTKPKRPTRDEFELEEIGNQLVEAKDEGVEVSLMVWGETELVSGRITDMDARTKMVHIERHGQMMKVPFLDIMKISTAGY